VLVQGAKSHVRASMLDKCRSLFRNSEEWRIYIKEYEVLLMNKGTEWRGFHT
jgi:hypothetical protein